MSVVNLDDRDKGRNRVLLGEGARRCGGAFDIASVADSGGGVGAEGALEGATRGDVL